jgi:hypothetical protein
MMRDHNSKRTVHVRVQRKLQYSYTCSSLVLYTYCSPTVAKTVWYEYWVVERNHGHKDARGADHRVHVSLVRASRPQRTAPLVMGKTRVIEVSHGLGLGLGPVSLHPFFRAE